MALDFLQGIEFEVKIPVKIKHKKTAINGGNARQGCSKNQKQQMTPRALSDTVAPRQ